MGDRGMPALAYQPLEQTIAQETVPLEAMNRPAAANRVGALAAPEVTQQGGTRRGNFALVLTNAIHIYPLAGGATTIGRDKNCRIQLTDPVISRQHATIVLNNDNLVITDLCSTNGTFINGHKVTCTTLLRGGDRVRVGTYEFVVAA